MAAVNDFTSYININDRNAFRQFTLTLTACLKDTYRAAHNDLVIVCIGTDRSTGDSLGPLIGYKLTTLKCQNIYVHGTLDQPVHAKNLNECLEYIKKAYANPFIIAIDACLGKIEHIGYVTISRGCLKPGAGVNKNLPEIGNISITGIVNFSGFMDYILLQNTRLSLVMKMADLIALGLKYVLWKNNRHPLKTSLDKTKSYMVKEEIL